MHFKDNYVVISIRNIHFSLSQQVYVQTSCSGILGEVGVEKFFEIYTEGHNPESSRKLLKVLMIF